MLGIVDTTVIIHLFRQDAQAWAWFNQLSQPLGITPLTWMEVIYGASNKTKQATCKNILNQFQMLYFLPADMDWAMQQLEKYCLSHAASINDCVIASVAHRLQIPLYSHNLKDMTLLVGNLAMRPY